jgi:transposase
MNRVSRIAASLAAVSILSVIALTARTASAVECSNKFGDQKEVSGGAADQVSAEKELAKALKEALASAANDCKEKTCTAEAKAKCRFVHTVTKPNCKPGPGAPAPAIICSQRYRAGCFCLKEDEQIELRAGAHHEDR